MTQDATPSAVADLSYLRNLATAGQNAPLMAGPYLVAGGAWFAAASLLQWPVIRDVLELDAGPAVLAWLLAAAGFAIHLTVLLRRDRGRVENTSNRAVNAVWSGIGWCIFAFWVGAAIMSYRKGDAFLMNAVSLHVLAVYGVGWTVAAVMTGRGWMQFNAATTLLTVPVLGALVGTGQEYLAYAIALVLTAIVPGLRIMRESRLIEPSPSGS